MTMRIYRGSFTTGSGTQINGFLYPIYTHMTAYGWKSVGESNGTIGGMGVTGIITSAASLSSGTSWFVIRSPDYQRQLLFFRSALGNGYMGISYSRSTGYVGGSSSTLPTASDDMSILAATFWSSNFDSYPGLTGFFLAMDDEYPYGLYFVDRVRYKIFFMAPLQIIQDSDQDPYIFGLLTADPTSVKCWHPDNLTQVTIVSPTWGGFFPYTGSTAYQGGSLDSQGQVIALPSLWLSPKSSLNIFKGFSTWIRWHGENSSAMGNEIVFNSATSIKIGSAVFPWDGMMP